MRKNAAQVGQMLSPQGKIMQVNKKFGNNNIKDQQGSTLIRYDTLPLDGRNEFRFFEGAATRKFPDTNMGSEGNKLGVGYTMVVQRAYLSVVTKDPDTGAWLTVAAVTLATFPDLLNGEFFFEIANSAVLKNLPILSWVPEFNKVAENQLNNSFEFDTLIVIPPLLEFVSIVRTLASKTVADGYLRLTIEGVGSMISPRANF